MGNWKQIRRAIRLAIDRVPVMNALVLASAGYKILTKKQAESIVEATAWHARRSVYRQQRAYRGLLTDLRHGSPRIDFRVAADAVNSTLLEHPSLLEIGCGNGYYSEVFQKLSPGIAYRGTDYSIEMIESARENYPDGNFEVADATALPFANCSFDIAFNGVCLMHIVNYELAIREAARIAKSHVIFHSVPVVQERETTYLRKYAYGAPVTEVIFNRRNLEETFSRNGLRIKSAQHSIPYDVSHILNTPSICLTYVCEKANSADAESGS